MKGTSCCCTRHTDDIHVEHLDNHALGKSSVVSRSANQNPAGNHYVLESLLDLQRRLEGVVADVRRSHGVLAGEDKHDGFQAELARLRDRNLHLERQLATQGFPNESASISASGVLGAKLGTPAGSVLQAKSSVHPEAPSDVLGVHMQVTATENMPELPDIALGEAPMPKEQLPMQPGTLNTNVPNSASNGLSSAGTRSTNGPDGVGENFGRASSLETVMTAQSALVPAGPSRRGVNRRGSATRMNEPTTVEAPLRALVINVRKLVNTRETQNILHELITSTAIAALTLVNAGSSQQLCCTVMFIACTSIVFVLHRWQWDLLEVDDFRMLLPMLADDEEFGIVNPNRLLKAMSVSGWRMWRWLYSLIYVCGVSLMVCAWIMVHSWWNVNDGDDTNDSHGIVDRWREVFVITEEDGLVLGMQVVVGTLMFCLHLSFEIILYNEICSVMPRTFKNGIWDPRIDGVPWRYRLFGLPGIWFTSQEALDDFKYWIDQATPGTCVQEIYPQEMAYYALCGDLERQEVQLSLKHAKLYDGSKHTFMDRHRNGEVEELNIELTFFDEALQNMDCPFPGEFLSIVDRDDSDPFDHSATDPLDMRHWVDGHREQGRMVARVRLTSGSA